MRSLICYNPRTRNRTVFKTTSEAARALSLDRVTLSHAANRTHGMPTYAGYVFWWTAGEARDCIAVRVSDGQIDFTEPSITKTAEVLGVAHETVRSHLEGKLGSYALERVGATPNPRFAGRKHTAETRARMSAAKTAKKRRVVMYDGGMAMEFESQAEAARYLTRQVGHLVRHSAVCSAVRNDRRLHGYRWRYA